VNAKLQCTVNESEVQTLSSNKMLVSLYFVLSYAGIAIYFNALCDFCTFDGNYPNAFFSTGTASSQCISRP